MSTKILHLLKVANTRCHRSIASQVSLLEHSWHLKKPMFSKARTLDSMSEELQGLPRKTRWNYVRERDSTSSEIPPAFPPFILRHVLVHSTGSRITQCIWLYTTPEWPENSNVHGFTTQTSIRIQMRPDSPKVYNLSIPNQPQTENKQFCHLFSGHFVIESFSLP